MSTDGPIHYIANTVYHAGDRDCWGLRAGESRQIKNGKTGLPCWELKYIGDTLPQYVDSDTPPNNPPGQYKYVPRCHIGEGKKRDLDAARSCAVWPDATDEELSVECEELTASLQERLPALIAEFRADMDAIGMLWEV